MAKLLVIEDDPGTLLTLEQIFRPEHSVASCMTLTDARDALEANTFDLILLDVILPDGNGFDFLGDIKSTGVLDKSVVLFLTHKSAVMDQILGLSLGAQDYLLKPIHPMLIQARVNSRLRLSQEAEVKSGLFQCGDLHFDLSKQKAWVQTLGKTKELELTQLEFKFLLHLARQEDRIFSREQLLSAIWGDQIHIIDRTVDTHVCHLRSKLKGTEYSVRAVHGSGYKLTRAVATARKAA